MENSENVVAQYKQQFEKVCSDADDRLSQYPLFARLRESTGVRPAHASLAIIVFLFLLLVFGLGLDAVVKLICFLYPAHASFSCLRQANQANANLTNDNKHWITYWVLFSFFTVLESVAESVMDWVPFYHLVKALFLSWAYLPQTRGAERLYVVLFEPLMNKLDNIGGVLSSGNPVVKQKSPVETAVDKVQEAVEKPIRKIGNNFATLSKKALTDLQDAPADVNKLD